MATLREFQESKLPGTPTDPFAFKTLSTARNALGKTYDWITREPENYDRLSPAEKRLAHNEVEKALRVFMTTTLFPMRKDVQDELDRRRQEAIAKPLFNETDFRHANTQLILHEEFLTQKISMLMKRHEDYRLNQMMVFAQDLRGDELKNFITKHLQPAYEDALTSWDRCKQTAPAGEPDAAFKARNKDVIDRVNKLGKAMGLAAVGLTQDAPANDPFTKAPPDIFDRAVARVGSWINTLRAKILPTPTTPAGLFPVLSDAVDVLPQVPPQTEPVAIENIDVSFGAFVRHEARKVMPALRSFFQSTSGRVAGAAGAGLLVVGALAAWHPTGTDPAALTAHTGTGIRPVTMIADFNNATTPAAPAAMTAPAPATAEATTHANIVKPTFHRASNDDAPRPAVQIAKVTMNGQTLNIDAETQKNACGYLKTQGLTSWLCEKQPA